MAKGEQVWRKGSQTEALMLAGTWHCNNEGPYVVTHSGKRLVWKGTSGDQGRSFTLQENGTARFAYGARATGSVQGNELVWRWQNNRTNYLQLPVDVIELYCERSHGKSMRLRA
jgi:hypothetical protein